VIKQERERFRRFLVQVTRRKNALNKEVPYGCTNVYCVFDECSAVYVRLGLSVVRVGGRVQVSLSQAF